MSEFVRKATVKWNRFKDVIMLCYSIVMIIMGFVVLMEIKLQFHLNIPYVDLPFDEWYQKLSGRS